MRRLAGETKDVLHRPVVRLAFCATVAGFLAFYSTPTLADDLAPASDPTQQRPAIQFNRWQEDWSVLADPDVPREPFDNLKYIPLSAGDPKAYLSLGLDVRERFEANDAASFGTGPLGHSADYLLSRLEAHADLHLGPEVQIFTQLESAFAPGKTILTPVDQDRAAVEEAFVAITKPLGGGVLHVRVGRQQISFDLQRFISVRDGPNLRQSYDAAWADYERGPWRMLGFYSQPVQNRDQSAFDDYSSDHLTYGGFRIERKLFGFASLSISFSKFTQDAVKFLTVAGNERRDILDVHFAGSAQGFDWDAEAMSQTGRIANDDIEAWAVGSLVGYTLREAPWAPRLGLQLDAASGDTNPLDHRLGTFNPLFPNGYYVTLSGYTGYVNFIHLKPSVTVHPLKTVKLMFAAAALWRETTADAVYTQPDIPVAGTAGRPGHYTGTYGQFRAEWAATPHYSLALEFVHFAVSDVIRQAGGHDSNFLGAEIKYGW